MVLGRQMIVLAGFIAAAVLAAAGTWIVRRNALSRGMIDRPNERSSHVVPVPRGGGLAIVVTVTLGMFGLWWAGVADTSLALAVVGGGCAVALIGWMDDRRSLPAFVRILVHFGSSAWAIWILGGLPPVQWGSAVVDLGLPGDVVAVLGVVWALNLFNFMDGIDGLAASEAVFVAGAGAVAQYYGPYGSSHAALLVAAAALGFLAWNRPPAKIFMGDVGSGYLGFVIAVLAIRFSRDFAAGIYVWLILGGVFLADATVTLVRRAARGERVHVAHRTHAYQRLARRWGGHARVTLATVALNCLWLWPCALLATAYPASARWIALVALGPIVMLAIAAGAGIADRSSGRER
jgi:Fuc2NAc and GlcNAc transferase